MLSYIMKRSLFPLGTILIAPEIESLGIDIQRLLRRHQSGDFGCVDSYDAEQNLKALESGEGILSQYDILVGQNTILICVMTESDRSFTVVFILDKSKLDFPNLPEGEIQPGSEHS